ncbi:tRNA (guanosine(46)-N7)-methyltransferase TrmB [Acidithiobacillus sp. IBUN Pt1247-S3]|uniref:tRNA (guanosine(46)-N7)-methyltransferase TrmB n=1 Tax=Acidithiobacillus sp. IBUN Pt1247-S3 TaxID=3166642 RepID=UPI0034E46D7E
MNETLKPEFRPIRSFVLRQGRLTTAQERILQERGDFYCLDARKPWQSPWDTSRPLMLEIGFGNGEHLAQFAQSHPDWGCLGAEVHGPGVGSLLLRAEAAGLMNLRVLHEDVVPWLRALPDSTLSLIVVQFPDPWPKKRHHKRRIIQADFLALLGRVVRPGGELQLATDWEPYAEQMLALLDAADGWENLAGVGNYGSPPENRIQTRFERRGTALGHQVFDLHFRRRGR